MGTEDVLVQLSRTVTGMEGQTMTTTRTLLARPSSDSSTSHFVTDDKDIETTRPESSPPSSPSQLLGQTSSSSRQTMADMVVSLASVDDGSSEVKANREGPKGPRPEHSPSISPRSPPISELQSTRVEVEIKTPGIPSGVRFPTSSAVRPRTSLFLSSPIAGLSLPSSPRSYSSKSLRQEDSDEMGDDIASQAIASSEDDEMDLPAGARNSAPQLIMPSIKIPSRRPFTDRGKHIGRIKVLIAGGSGTGKTSLIKSIVQNCEDIVHVDAISANGPHVSIPESKPPLTGRWNGEHSSTKTITEIYASTRPYPTWWSDLDQSRVLRRRKSQGDTVLERNICFVDTPGYGKESSSPTEIIDAIVDYVETLLLRTTSMEHMIDEEVINLLGGDGGPQVDVVFLLLSHKLRWSDMELMRRLAPLTNVIPLIGKHDLLTSDQTIALKTSIRRKLQTANLRPFHIGWSNGAVSRSEEIGLPFAISSATASDAENMDASLLMSADYVPPLVPSELTTLTDRVFGPDGVALLRHAAARQVARWRHRSPTRGALTRPSVGLGSAGGVDAIGPSSSLTSSSSSVMGRSSLESSKVLVPPMGVMSTYAVARLADHRQREETMAQVRLAKWASDLQRSLQHERERYEAMARRERVIWLTQRLGECVLDGSLVPAPAAGDLAGPRHGTDRYIRRRSTGTGTLASFPEWTLNDPSDPLGLLSGCDVSQRHGWQALGLVGGLGVVGGLAMWLTRHWDLTSGEWPNWPWSN